MRHTQSVLVSLSKPRGNSQTKYDDYISWINAKGYLKVNDNQQPLSFTGQYGALVAVTMLGTESGNMWGSPYNHVFNNDSTLTRVIQHAMPDRVTFDENRTKLRTVLMRLNSVGSPSTNAVTRNGYTSASYGAFASCNMTEFIYWDEVLQKLRTYNPSIVSTIRDYVMA